MPITKINPEIIPFTNNLKKVNSKCLRKGKNFRKGCPNYNKKIGCPPNQPIINEIFDFSKEMFLIYRDVNIYKQAKRMKNIHPEWTEKQCYNPRYWQQRERKKHLKLDLEKFMRENSFCIYNTSPEAHGVNVHVLFYKITGKILEWPPRKLSRIISLGGYPKS